MNNHTPQPNRRSFQQPETPAVKRRLIDKLYDDDTERQKDALHSLPGFTTTPFEAFVANRIEQVLEDSTELSFEVLDLIRKAYATGFKDANCKMGDLL